MILPNLWRVHRTGNPMTGRHASHTLFSRVAIVTRFHGVSRAMQLRHETDDLTHGPSQISDPWPAALLATVSGVSSAGDFSCALILTRGIRFRLSERFQHVSPNSSVTWIVTARPFRRVTRTPHDGYPTGKGVPFPRIERHRFRPVPSRLRLAPYRG